MGIGCRAGLGLFLLTALLAAAPRAQAAAPGQHVVVHHQAGQMAAWPANGGLWTWDDGAEALVGFTAGKFKEQSGHNIELPHLNMLARSRDGGLTWSTEQPATYAQEGAACRALAEAVDYQRPGFAMRMAATGYHGAANPRGGFQYSYDRGQTWQGPFLFPGLDKVDALKGLDITTRTDYLSEGPGACLLLMAARLKDKSGTDRVFAARATDGGQKVEFLNWVVGREDPYRAVMPATVRCGERKLVSAVRRRELAVEHCWVDLYGSEDDGKTWRLVSKVGETGRGNGNPPALVRLRDRRLVCAYGNRDRDRMLARVSGDEGATWGPELVVREGYKRDKHGDSDLGYPRLFQRPDGRLVAIYYWATAERIEPHIEATIWKAP